MQFELRQLQRQLGITTVLVTHDQEEALTMSDLVAVMKDGEILQYGPPETVYQRPASRFVAEFLGASNVFRGRLTRRANGTAVLEAATELRAVLGAVPKAEPLVLTIADGRALPSGPFESGHRTLQTGLRSWVAQQTHHPLGYLEQLYTFADRDRTRDGAGGRVVSIS